MAAQICNPSTQEAKVGESRVQGQPRLHGETITKKNEKEEKTKGVK
jgi:hypothetical protein